VPSYTWYHVEVASKPSWRVGPYLTALRQKRLTRETESPRDRLLRVNLAKLASVLDLGSRRMLGYRWLITCAPLRGALTTAAPFMKVVRPCDGSISRSSRRR